MNLGELLTELGIETDSIESGYLDLGINVCVVHKEAGETSPPVQIESVTVYDFGNGAEVVITTALL